MERETLTQIALAHLSTDTLKKIAREHHLRVPSKKEDGILCTYGSFGIPSRKFFFLISTRKSVKEIYSKLWYFE